MKARTLALATGLIGVLALAWGAIHDIREFYRSYLLAYLYWLDLPMGAFALLMVYHLTGGAWGASTRRILEAAVRTLPWMGLLFVPVLCGLGHLYPWTDSAAVQANETLRHKHVYLNIPFFVARTVLYFVCWIGISRALLAASAGEEVGASFDARKRLRTISAPGLLVYGLTVTFAAIDWQMSLEPLWYSTIYGLVFAVGQGLAGWAFTVLIFGWLCLSAKPHRMDFPNKVYRDIGNIQLMFLILWTYLSFMQYLIIWMGNLPEEVTWVLNRTRGGWQVSAVLLVIFQFAAPFSVLLFRGVKERIRVMRWVAIVILLIHVVDRQWFVMPAFYPQHLHFSWMNLAALAAIGGLWLWLFLGKLDAYPVFAVTDRSWPEVAAHA
jgi:hypothetical protein